jgi:hypothetical protein
MMTRSSLGSKPDGLLIRAIVIVAAVPAVAFVAARVLVPSNDPTPVNPMRAETIRVTDTTPFRARWQAAADLPPAIEREPPVKMVRTIPVRVEAPVERPRLERIVRATRRDVCTRHRMHKEYYRRGRWMHWRCRK